MRIDADPLTLAVALGLLSPIALEPDRPEPPRPAPPPRRVARPAPRRGS